MRIAINTNRFPSLSQTPLIGQIVALLERGHDVQIFARGEDDDVVHRAVDRYRLRERTHQIPRSPAGFYPVLKDAVSLLRSKPQTLARAFGTLIPHRLSASAITLSPFAHALRTARTGPYDAVLSIYGPNGVDAERLRRARALSGRTFTAFLGYDMSRHVRQHGPRVYRPLFEHGDWMLPICRYFRDKLVAWGCPEDKIVIHHVGIDCDEFDFSPRHRHAGDPLRVITVARLVPKKGIVHALHAVAQLAKQFPIEYHIVGDGPLRNQIEECAQQLQLGDRVVLHGAQEQTSVRDIMQRMHIMLAPSVTAEDGDEEGTPVVLMEALSTGMPVLSTQHAGIPEVVDHGVSGLLVPEGDRQALAAGLTWFANHEDRRAEMGAAGRSKVVAQFNQHRLNERLVAMLSGEAALGSGCEKPLRPLRSPR